MDLQALFARHVLPGNHAGSDYFALLRDLVALRHSLASDSPDTPQVQAAIDRAYALVEDEIRNNTAPPAREISFGTSGWRGIIGKELNLTSIGRVTQAMVEMYRELDRDQTLAGLLGVASFAEAQKKGAVLGHDNRFGGSLMAGRVKDVLTSNGITVHDAGEATTGTLSAAVLTLGAAFSVNLTPSHNPLEYGGVKFNAADAGPAAAPITNRITEIARRLTAAGSPVALEPDPSLVRPCDALTCWLDLVRANTAVHGLDHGEIVQRFLAADNCVLAVDCVHGASRVHMAGLFNNLAPARFILLRDTPDPTFGGVAPEPSSANMQQVMAVLRGRPEPLRLGAIIDPDADRIRFTDGESEIDMNHFGAMAFHYLHEHKKKQGLVAKSVASSNFANAIARALGEEVFEPRVGFKEFKPVLGRALVCFEESDGITTMGHTPEKDAYIGLFLALDMVLSLGRNLGDSLRLLQEQYGFYYPGRGGVTVGRQGEELLAALGRLEKYGPGATVEVGGDKKRIDEVIAIDGRKMIFSDQSWLMIRPSGTEPKVRFYVEARNEAGKEDLLAAARGMLAEIGLL